MKKKKNVSTLSKIVILFLMFTSAAFSQDVYVDLGTSGKFQVRDINNLSDIFLNVDQSTGIVNVLKSLRLENTIDENTGVMYLSTNRFIHNYGLNNTFIGELSGNFIMTGTDNTSFGPYTLYNNTTGSFATAFGVGSLFSNTTGMRNTAIGNEAMKSNTIGNFNTALGFHSLTNNISGNRNTALGEQTLQNNIDGYNNVSMGFQTLALNTSGYKNTAIGVLALFSSTGNNNTAIGIEALGSSQTGNENTSVGSISLRFLTTGNSNTALGDSAGFNITTGNNNTTIGNFAQVPNGTLNNQVRIGNTLVTYAGVQVPWTITSDLRWKSNIATSNLGLNFISRIRPVSYTRNNDESNKTEYGFIAQEIEEVLKESGVDNSGMITIDENGKYEMRYNDLLAPMVKAIQELKTENDELRKEVGELKTVNEKLVILEQMVNELKSVNNTSQTKEVNSQILK